jgi:hypothetical protein
VGLSLALAASRSGVSHEPDQPPREPLSGQGPRRPLPPRCGEAVGVTVLPPIDDTRRWIALHAAVGDLDVEIGAGHDDIDDQIAQVGAQCQEWLERRMADRARRPVTDLDFP